MRSSSLRTELLVSFAILTFAALVCAAAMAVLLISTEDPARGTLYFVGLIAGDVAIVVGFGAYLVQRHIITPLRAAVDTAEALAAGDLRRRVPEQGPREFQTLARTLNRMTEHLIEERAQLVRAEKLASIGRLAAGVAHEIGNPLGAIAGYTHVLRRRTATALGASEVLDGLERESGRIDRIVRGLLDYARSRSSTPTRVDVNDAVRAVVDLLTMQGVLRRIELHIDLGTPSPVVQGQRHEIEQLLVNLLLNAADAMNGEGSISIRTECTTRNIPRVLGERAVRIIVADSGPGISVELAERVFDPFFTTKEPGKGTGLGLAIVARIIENLGGAISVTSSTEYGSGATFSMLLPHDGDRAPLRGVMPPPRAIAK